MSTPNWGRLVQQGRAKAIGVPWNEDEVKAVFHDGVPADYVRRGCLTQEEYQKLLKEDEKVEKKTGAKPVEAFSRAELEAKAKDLEVEFTSATPSEVLVSLIEKAKPKKASKKK